MWVFWYSVRQGLHLSSQHIHEAFIQCELSDTEGATELFSSYSKGLSPVWILTLKEHRTLAKRFPTFPTLIRPWFTVKPQVIKETGSVRKAVPTFPAHVRPLPVWTLWCWMRLASVLNNLPRSTHSLRPFSSVNSPMVIEVVPFAKRLPTRTTYIISCSREVSLVLNKCVFVLTSFHASSPFIMNFYVM